MDDGLSQATGLHLPQPAANTGQSFAQSPLSFQNTQPISQAQSSAQSSSTPLPVIAMPSDPLAPVADPLTSPASSSAPSAFVQDAVQNDEIDTALDEEWVGKAREIVERTQGDPYTQSRELSRVKAQYIKARYNKDIKISENQ